MTSFKINTSAGMPDDAYIHQNMTSFAKVVAKFKGFKLPAIQKAWFYGGGAGILTTAAIIATVAILQSGPDSTELFAPIDSLETTTAYVNPPLDNISPQYSSFVIDPSQENTLETPRGSKIHIPGNAFRDVNGAPVKEDVTIRFREIHDVLDMFTSGIPMIYDSAGIPHVFESAGMFEILASNGEQPLELMPQKEIVVDLVSYNPDLKFNLYYLDTNLQNWQYLDKSDFEKVPDCDEVLTVQNEQSSVQFDPFFNYVEPAKVSKSEYVCKVDYRKELFPEFSIYKKVLFEVDTRKSAFDPDLFLVNWEETTLKRSKQNGYYILHLERPDTSIRLFVKPVIADEDYAEAVRSYENEKLRTENANMQTRKQSEELIGSRRNDLEYDAESYILSTVDSKAPVYVSVRVARMGYYNCDYAMPSRNFTFNPVFTENGERIIPERIYITDIAVNAIFEFDGDVKEIQCNRNASMVLWVVGSGNRMAVIPADEFDKYTRGKKEVVFPLQFLDANTGLVILHRALKGERNIDMSNETNTLEKAPEKNETADYTISDDANEGTTATLRCFPNPASDYVNFELESAGVELFRIYSANGALLDEIRPDAGASKIRLDVSGYEAGGYFCTANTSKKTLSVRFLVMR